MWTCLLCTAPIRSREDLVEVGDLNSCFHMACANEVAEAAARARQARGRCVEHNGSDAATPSDLKLLEERIRRIEAVWKLWIVDATKGAINPGTFAAMKALLGMTEEL